jgi:hypothetical protein
MTSLVSKIVVAVIVLLLVGATLSVWKKHAEGPVEPVACTLEAKICPDGTAVGRTGPHCEFEACPVQDDSDVDVWIHSTDVGQGVSFEYPKTIALTYLHEVEWPPKVKILSTPFTCTEVGNETTQVGITTQETIDDRAYCVTKQSEGAAGSIYTSYSYAFPFENKTAVFAFSLRYPQCGNYDEPKATECRSQQTELKPLHFVDRMANTLRVN